MAYIYKIINDINDKVYIGKTEFNIQKRFKEHCLDSRKQRHEKRPLYNAMSKYGVEHFEIVLVEEVDSEKAVEREKYWIKQYKAYETGYNATLGGDGKSYLDYKKILKLYDTTLKSQKEIANECNCSIDSVKNIVRQYRDDVDWLLRKSYSKKPNSLDIKGITVRCKETGEVFPSCTQAGNWLVKNGKVKSKGYARNGVAKCCKDPLKHKTCGGYTWEYV